MSERQITISQNTLIPISLVITLIGLVWFGASVYAQVQSNTEKISTFLSAVEGLNDKLTRTNENVIKLNATLEAQGNQARVESKTPSTVVQVNPPRSSSSTTNNSYTYQTPSPSPSPTPQQSLTLADILGGLL